MRQRCSVMYNAFSRSDANLSVWATRTTCPKSRQPELRRGGWVIEIVEEDNGTCPTTLVVFPLGEHHCHEQVRKNYALPRNAAVRGLVEIGLTSSVT